MSGMRRFVTNDGVGLRFLDTGVGGGDGDGGGGGGGGGGKPWLVLIHGFTGSSQVWKRNIQAFSAQYRVIVPDLRGHGESDKPDHGFQVSRLAMDLRELVLLLQSTEAEPAREWKAIGGSLGCSILWCYASLFTTSPFTHTIFVDQSPLQNSLPDWSSAFCNRGMNNALAVSALQTTLATSPETAHRGTIAACLSYLAYPLPTDFPSEEKREEVTRADEEFFLGEAMKGHQTWYGQLMADHTALDWRASIAATFGRASPSQTKVLVVASSRSGCFPAEGPLYVVGLVGARASGWEDPEKFNELALNFLSGGEADAAMGRWVGVAA
ncbi:hypothetical protein MBM_04445 [Drepanopeziza brunnea f. sp. 'multigermtubi' MB_m1]|uniref:AB hydrolase-1 domain-containing protein n=1 Tax=Marssonina brunnea f. sp. multigermtubi (strain MB_m1) TaxID=1072389 RepID=K1XXP9_MARBU|nr:uncharacterized protein MBM_04445 [Drepanopeziza brunnea f. sp. 'multigermtubi' MB_m1]EKD17584.1 hypothetical protein MBM_04445 [Drepanopeziza brunnea f. sp. 'multigermtubi' MB_m1]